MPEQKTTYRFIGKVLSDGHLFIPEEAAKTVGKKFEVLLTPIDDTEVLISSYLEDRLKKQGRIKDIILNFPESIDAIKATFGTTDIDAIIESVRR